MDKNQTHPQIPPPMQLFDHLIGFMKTQTIHTMVRLGIADTLAGGSKTAEQLSDLVNVPGTKLSRLLSALVGLSVIQMDDGMSYSLTPAGMCLTDASPISMKSLALMVGDSAWWLPWQKLVSSMESDDSVFENIFQMDYDRYLDAYPETGKIFMDCLAGVNKANIPAIVDSYDFSRHRTLVDVGGGHGSLLTAILDNHKSGSGILFDRPQMLDSAEPFPDSVGDRLRLEPGDFFQAIPQEGDAYLLKQVIHDWNDDRSVKILKNCRDAMKKDSRILIIEALMNPEEMPLPALLFDLHMLVISDGGRERTLDEYKTLLNAADLELVTVHPTPTSFSIMEAKSATDTA